MFIYSFKKPNDIISRINTINAGTVKAENINHDKRFKLIHAIKINIVCFDVFFFKFNTAEIKAHSERQPVKRGI